MVPRADIPRSTFTTEHNLKTTFDGGYLVPILVNEVLPGDSIHGQLTAFARMNTLLFPLMDHLTLETFFFFVPCRIVWRQWTRFMGEQANPSDTISYTIPVTTSPAGGWAVGSLQDYLGLPVAGQITGANTVTHNVLPIRCYTRIWLEWFRDENLQNAPATPDNDGPDANTDGVLLRRGKKHDYFTSALLWTQKTYPGSSPFGVSVPLAGTAPITGIGAISGAVGTTGPHNVWETNKGATTAYAGDYVTSVANVLAVKMQQQGVGPGVTNTPQIFADLTQASGVLINTLRLAVQTQRLLERDARGGTRYVELLRSHFGVQPEDFRLQRPEYIGGGKSSVQTQAIPQTAPAAGGSTPLAALAGQSTVTGQHHFSYQATEHGYLIGLCHVDAELTYQQGLHRMWTRSTRYDFYWPVFAHLGEQAIRNDEIYVTGTATDVQTFGFQERWAEYRHMPSRISGLFRSTSTGTIDTWHSAQKFTALPVLGDTFIQSTPPFARNLAAGSQANGMQFLADFLFRIKFTRAMPMYSVPGSMDRF